MSTRWSVWFASAFLVLLSAGVSPAAAQGSRITGVVTDSLTGEPLPGVTVVVEGTTLRNTTRENGQYIITGVPTGTYTVAAQRLGYIRSAQQDVRVTEDAPGTANFALREAVLRLQEITASATVDPIAGVQSPLSVSKLGRQEVATVPTTGSAAAAIQGKVAGVQIVRNSGQPGEGVNVQLRTPTVIMTGGTRSNSPMYVVDGVILAQQVGGTTVDLESLDIESVEVIKGAAAASLYGSRAASGVISITTRRGRELREGRTQITLRSEYGVDMAPDNLRLTRSHNFLVDSQGQYINENGDPITTLSERVPSGDDFQDKPFPGPTYNNIKNVFDPGSFMTQSFSVAHMTASSNFLLSFNNFEQTGALQGNDGFERRNFRVNLDHRLGDNVQFSVSAFHSRSKQDDVIGGATGEGSVFWDIMLYPSDVNLAATDEHGKFIRQPDPLVNVINPLWEQQNFENVDRRSRTLANITTRYAPLSWLTFQGDVSYDRADLNDMSYTAKGTPTSADGTNESDGSIDFDDEFSDVMNGSLSGTAMHSFRDLTARVTVRGVFEREKNLTIAADGDDFTVIDVPDIDAARTVNAASGATEIRSQGIMVQTGLDWGGKYVLDALVRRDGSSLFGPDARWNTYHRVAGAWLLGREAWWPFPQFNEFKLRYAWGTAGSRPNFTDQYETWNVNGTTGAITKTALGNKNLRPAHTSEHEAGVDFILNDRFAVELTYVRQTTRDQIIQMSVPAHTGYQIQWQNSGTNQGTTYEATFQANVINREGLNWTTTLVADRSRSKITEWNRPCFFDGLNNVCQGAALDEMWGESWLTSLSQLPGDLPADQFQVNDDGLVVWVGEGNSWQDGLWGTQTTIDGRRFAWGMPVKMVDADGNPIFTQIGSSAPEAQIGWINNVRWRGFTFHVQLHGQIGGQVYNGTRQRMYQHARHADVDQAGKPGWAKKPVGYYLAVYNTNENTNYFVEDGEFLKLREVSIQYRFTRDQLSRLGALGMLAPEGLTLGINGRNLLTITPYSGFDPEVGSVLQRRDTFAYPNTRNFTGFVEITF